MRGEDSKKKAGIGEDDSLEVQERREGKRLAGVQG